MAERSLSTHPWWPSCCTQDNQSIRFICSEFKRNDALLGNFPWRENKVRVSCRKCDGILWITRWTIVVDTSHHRDELWAGACQIDEIQSQSVGGKFNFSQTSNEIVVNSGAEKCSRIDRATNIDFGWRQNCKLSSNVRVIGVDFVDHNYQLLCESAVICSEIGKKWQDKRQFVSFSTYLIDFVDVPLLLLLLQFVKLSTKTSRWRIYYLSLSTTAHDDSSTHPTKARHGRNFLNSPMNSHFVPLMVVESHARWLNVHFLFTVRQTHRQRHTAIAYRQIQVIGSVT